MAIERIRIYPGHDPESMIIGFSMGVWGIPHCGQFKDFIKENGYAWNWTVHPPVDTVSDDHVDIRPPLSEAHIEELGKLILGRMTDGRFAQGLIPPSSHSVWIMDNRTHPPLHVFDQSNAIILQSPAGGM